MKALWVTALKGSKMCRILLSPLLQEDRWYRLWRCSALYLAAWTHMASLRLAASGEDFPVAAFNFGSDSAFLIRLDVLSWEINFLISASSHLCCGWLTHWSFFQLEMFIGSVTLGCWDILLKFTYECILALQTGRLASRNHLGWTGPACQLPIHRVWNLLWADLRNWNLMFNLVIVFPDSCCIYYFLVRKLFCSIL